jgi:uncharacterized protein (TIGR02246 family)
MSQEAEIRAAMAAWARALEAKDLDAMLRDYEPDAVLYDVGGQYVGLPAIRKIWEFCLPYFPETFHSKHEDVTILAGPEVAVMHALHRFEVPGDPAHMMAQSGTRVTVAYRKRDGVWRVTHEHASMPYDFDKGQLIKV